MADEWNEEPASSGFDSGGGDGGGGGGGNGGGGGGGSGCDGNGSFRSDGGRMKSCFNCFNCFNSAEEGDDSAGPKCLLVSDVIFLLIFDSFVIVIYFAYSCCFIARAPISLIKLGSFMLSPRWSFPPAR